MSKRIKREKLVVATRDEAAAMVHDVAVLMNCRRSIQAQKDAAILEIEEQFENRFSEVDADIAPKVDAVEAWASAHPEEFEKRKSVDFGTALVGFRTGTPKLALLGRSWTWEKVLNAIRQYMPAFIRDKPEIDKEAIIAQRDDPTLKMVLPNVGIKVVQGETFFIEPKLSEPEKRETREAA